MFPPRPEGRSLHKPNKMTRKTDLRQIDRDGLKKAVADYLRWTNTTIDSNDMGDFLFDHMSHVPETGYCRRCGDECFNLVAGLCSLCADEIEYERISRMYGGLLGPHRRIREGLSKE